MWGKGGGAGRGLESQREAGRREALGADTRVGNKAPSWSAPAPRTCPVGVHIWKHLEKQLSPASPVPGVGGRRVGQDGDQGRSMPPA